MTKHRNLASLFSYITDHYNPQIYSGFCVETEYEEQDGFFVAIHKLTFQNRGGSGSSSRSRDYQRSTNWSSGKKASSNARWKREKKKGYWW